MATLTASPARVTRSFRRELPPVKEPRVAPRPATRFALGLEGDAVLTHSWTANGFAFDLVEHEGTDADYLYFLYASRDGVLVERKGFDSVKDARTYAWHLSEPLPVEPEPAVEPEPVITRKPVAKPVNRPSFPMRATRHTAADEAWWVAHSPTSRSFFYVEGSVDPYATENLTLSAFDYHVNEMMSCSCPDLGDHFGSDYLSHEEGVTL